MVDTIRPIREDTRSVTVTIYKPGSDVVLMKGIWDNKTGGQVDSEETLYHPGAMEDPIQLGGRRNVENLTLSRLCRVGRDWELIPALVAAAGKAEVTVADTPLDPDGNTYPGVNSLTYKGKLKRVTPPPANSEGTGAAMIEIEVSVEGYPA